MNLRMCESPGNPSRIAALSADQALTAIIGCPHMDFRRIVRIAVGVGRRTWSPPAKLGLAPRFAGLWVVRASIFAPRTKRSPRPCQPFPLKIGDEDTDQGRLAAIHGACNSVTVRGCLASNFLRVA